MRDNKYVSSIHQQGGGAAVFGQACWDQRKRSQRSSIIWIIALKQVKGYQNFFLKVILKKNELSFRPPDPPLSLLRDPQ